MYWSSRSEFQPQWVSASAIILSAKILGSYLQSRRRWTAASNCSTLCQLSSPGATWLVLTQTGTPSKPAPVRPSFKQKKERKTIRDHSAMKQPKVASSCHALTDSRPTVAQIHCTCCSISVWPCRLINRSPWPTKLYYGFAALFFILFF